MLGLLKHFILMFLRNVCFFLQQNLGTTPTDLLIYNLPLNYDKSRIKNRLKMLTDNCGGRVMNIVPERGVATIRFSSIDFASRYVQNTGTFSSKFFTK